MSSIDSNFLRIPRSQTEDRLEEKKTEKKVERSFRSGRSGSFVQFTLPEGKNKLTTKEINDYTEVKFADDASISSEGSPGKRNKSDPEMKIRIEKYATDRLSMSNKSRIAKIAKSAPDMTKLNQLTGNSFKTLEEALDSLKKEAEENVFFKSFDLLCRVELEKALKNCSEIQANNFADCSLIEKVIKEISEELKKKPISKFIGSQLEQLFKRISYVSPATDQTENFLKILTNLLREDLLEFNSYLLKLEDKQIQSWIFEVIEWKKVQEFLNNLDKNVDKTVHALFAEKIQTIPGAVHGEIESKLIPKEKDKDINWVNLRKKVKQYLLVPHVREVLPPALNTIRTCLHHHHQPPSSFSLYIIIEQFQKIDRTSEMVSAIETIRDKHVSALMLGLAGGTKALKRTKKKIDDFTKSLLDKSTKIEDLKKLGEEFEARLENKIQQEIEKKLGQIKDWESIPKLEEQIVSSLVVEFEKGPILMTHIVERIKRFIDVLSPLREQSPRTSVFVITLETLSKETINPKQLLEIIAGIQDQLVKEWIEQKVIGKPLYEKLVKLDRIIKDKTLYCLRNLPKHLQQEATNLLSDLIDELNKKMPVTCSLDNAIDREVLECLKRYEEEKNTLEAFIKSPERIVKDILALNLNYSASLMEVMNQRLFKARGALEKFLSKHPVLTKWIYALRQAFNENCEHALPKQLIINLKNITNSQIKDLMGKIVGEKSVDFFEFSTYVKEIVIESLKIEQQRRLVEKKYLIKWSDEKHNPLFKNIPLNDIVSGICPSEGHLFNQFSVKSYCPKYPPSPSDIPQKLNQHETFVSLLTLLIEKGWHFTEQAEPIKVLAEKTVGLQETPFTDFLTGMTIQALKPSTIKTGIHHYHPELHDKKPYKTTISKKWQEQEGAQGVKCEIEVHPDCAKIIKKFEERIQFYDTIFLTEKEEKKLKEFANSLSIGMGYQIASLHKQYTLIWQKNSPWKAEVQIPKVIFFAHAPFRSKKTIIESLKRYIST